MRSVTRVFAQIREGARTPEEIAVRSGVSISKVNEVLSFLTKFGLVDAVGGIYKASDDIADLP
jgi:sugar-specific transcriptional regulator TrmB